MNSTDPIADILTRLRNAIQARHKKVDIPASNVKREILRVLADERFVGGFAETKDDTQGILRVSLRYVDGISALTGAQRVSKPGLRVYVSARELPRVLNGMGIAIISTSNGIMTDKQAREQKVGGEVLCHIW